MNPEIELNKKWCLEEYYRTAIQEQLTKFYNLMERRVVSIEVNMYIIPVDLNNVVDKVICNLYGATSDLIPIASILQSKWRLERAIKNILSGGIEKLSQETNLLIDGISITIFTTSTHSLVDRVDCSVSCRPRKLIRLQIDICTDKEAIEYGRNATEEQYLWLMTQFKKYSDTCTQYHTIQEANIAYKFGVYAYICKIAMQSYKTMREEVLRANVGS